jgi:hypothetical protein
MAFPPAIPASHADGDFYYYSTGQSIFLVKTLGDFRRRPCLTLPGLADKMMDRKYEKER